MKTLSLLLVFLSVQNLFAQELDPLDRPGWYDAGAYKFIPFAGLALGGLSSIETSGIDSEGGGSFNVGIINEFALSERLFLRLRPGLTYRSYGVSIGGKPMGFSQFSFQTDIELKGQLSRRWALFGGIHSLTAIGGGSCSDSTIFESSDDDSGDDDWDWDDWDLKASTARTTEMVFNDDRDNLCDLMKDSRKSFILGLRGGVEFRVASRFLLEAYLEYDKRPFKTRLIDDSDFVSLGVNALLLAF